MSAGRRDAHGRAERRSGGAAMDAAPHWSFLAGKRIIDLSVLLPGPYATVLLADLGADVVKVEPPQGDLTRFNPRRFAAFNRNKRSVVIDLKSEGGLEQLLALVRGADAVVENFRPGVLDRLGCGWSVLHEVNPQVVLCSLSACGQQGPESRSPGHDLNFLAASGYFAVPGQVDGPVTRPGVRVADMVGGLYAALSLSVALASVEQGGEGQHLDVSLTDAAAACFGPFALSLPGDAPSSQSELVMGDNDLFTTSDGRRIAFAPFEDKFWLAFRKALEDEFPALATPAFDARLSRTSAKREVGVLLATVFAQRPFAWWADRLGRLDVPWTPVVEGPDDLIAMASAQRRGLLVDIETHEGEPMSVPRFPTVFGHGATTPGPPPRLGEHTEQFTSPAGGVRAADDAHGQDVAEVADRG